MSFGRDDETQGLALKYVVHRFKDNEIGLQAITGKPINFDLGSYYRGSGWVTFNDTSTALGNLTVTGYTPKLSGADENAYQFIVNIGTPPSTL